MSELYNYRKDESKPRPMEFNAEDKHLDMMRAIAPFAKAKVQENVTDIEIIPSTKNTKLALVLMPEWSPNFPPFSIARLSAVSRKAGYNTKCFDFNVKVHNESRKWLLENKIDFDPFDGAREWKWNPPHYYEEIHQHTEPLFKEYIKSIMEFDPDVVGFTLYYCNEQPVKWMMTELKKLKPSIKILLGGPHVALRQYQFLDPNDYPQGVIDYAVNGEGEMILLQILNEIEKGITHPTMQYLAQPENQRLNLNNLPLPDYSTFDFNEYVYPNGVNTEFSRGCIAKCSFCEETHFWKYRQRQAVDAITEIEWLYYNKGTDVIWFIDSLVNGNLNELRAFCKGVVAKGMKIHWTGYARHDGRMDLEYYKDLKAGGCEMLSYGCESGSQKVLNDMLKGVTIQEMEENMASGKVVGIGGLTNWIVGFPTEDYEDFGHTMTFIWRNRNTSIMTIAAGFGFGLGVNTVAGQNVERFEISPFFYLGSWMREDYRLSKIHVLTRVKSFAIFLQNMKSEEQISVPWRPNLPEFHYTLTFDDPEKLIEIDYEFGFDYNIIKPGISNFADSLVNEMFVLFRLLWKTRGGFEIHLKYDEELDMIEFGTRNAGPYWANHHFKIDDEGKWTYKCDHKFVQPGYDPVERIPFRLEDYSYTKLNASTRARRIAKPRWGENGRPDPEFKELEKQLVHMNNNVNFSFEYQWEGSGDWSNRPVEELTPLPNKKTLI